MRNKILRYKVTNKPKKELLAIFEDFYSIDDLKFTFTQAHILEKYDLKISQLTSILKRYTEGEILGDCFSCKEQYLQPFKGRQNYQSVISLCTNCHTRLRIEEEKRENLFQEEINKIQKIETDKKMAFLENGVIMKNYSTLTDSARIKLKQIFHFRSNEYLDLNHLRKNDIKHDSSISELIKKDLIVIEGSFEHFSQTYSHIDKIIVSPSLEKEFRSFLIDNRRIDDGTQSIQKQNLQDPLTTSRKRDIKKIVLNPTELSFLLRFSRNDYSTQCICSGEISIPEDILFKKNMHMVYSLWKSEKDGYHFSLKSKERILNYKNRSIDGEPKTIDKLLNYWEHDIK